MSWVHEQIPDYPASIGGRDRYTKYGSRIILIHQDRQRFTGKMWRWDYTIQALDEADFTGGHHWHDVAHRSIEFHTNSEMTRRWAVEEVMHELDTILMEEVL